MSFRISILTIARTKGVSVRTIHPQRKGRCYLITRQTEGLSRPSGIPRNDGQFSAYIPFYAWITGPLFNLLKGSIKWEWTGVHSEAFELCKQVLVNPPVHGYVKPGSPYRLYSDACDFRLAAILQQVQRIQLKDLKGMKAYKHCKKAFETGQLIPSLVVQITKLDNDVPKNGSWG